VGAASQWIVNSPPPPQATTQIPLAVAEPAPAPLAEPDPAPEAEPEPEPEPQLSPEQLRKLAGYSAGGQPLLGERLEATRELLERVVPEHYSLELFVTENSDPARMERFLVRARELVPLEEVYVIPVPAGGQYRLWVVFGEFASRDEALAAGRRLPPRYQQAFRAAPRSFEELRGQL